MRSRIWTAMALTLAATVSIGCGQADSVATPKENRAEHGDHDHGPPSATAQDNHDHSGWWCTEHGVPEEVCGQCNSKLAADFQKKGDWCKQHDRPDSQCFQCHPELQSKFAAQYEARFNKKPPTPEG